MDKKRIGITIGCVAILYALVYGIYGMLNYLFKNNFIDIIFVIVCLIAVFKPIKEKIFTSNSVASYVLTFFASAIVGQFTAPLVIGVIIADKIVFANTLSEIDSADMEELMLLKDDIAPYIKEYYDSEVDIKFNNIKVHIHGCKDYADILILDRKIDNRIADLQK